MGFQPVYPGKMPGLPPKRIGVLESGKDFTDLSKSGLLYIAS
jgi:hypothetical protein